MVPASEWFSRKFQKRAILGSLDRNKLFQRVACSWMIKKARSELVIMVQMVMVLLNHLPVRSLEHEVLAPPNKINF